MLAVHLIILGPCRLTFWPSVIHTCKIKCCRNLQKLMQTCKKIAMPLHMWCINHSTVHDACDWLMTLQICKSYSSASFCILLQVFATVYFTCAEPFGVSACSGTANISFDSSGHFPFRAQTNWQSHRGNWSLCPSDGTKTVMQDQSQNSSLQNQDTRSQDQDQDTGSQDPRHIHAWR